ncbi:hypothetical protein EZV62_001050 [Acer yangbiense]|uniref:Uncharacterized protein n=1 Tax=Acer yangbiense TaxID=1000413 RepID=A0A5C7IT75_9ROSI|nr:hypothetical protein EZV62_001050 [Acer yangbiense]
MGGFHSKKKKKNKAISYDDIHVKSSSLTEKIRLLREEINEMVHEREKERRDYEREVMVFAFKESEWKQERKKLREEVKRLRKNLQDKEDKMMRSVMEDDDHGLMKNNNNNNNISSSSSSTFQLKEWELLGTSFLVEQMREERARRDEAVEKWKHLYLAIKTELDHLIHTTHNGLSLSLSYISQFLIFYSLYFLGDGVVYRRAEEEETIQELRMEVKDKEESMEALKAQLTSTEQEVYRRERDIDILRQSLKIMSYDKKPSRASKTFSAKLHLSKKHTHDNINLRAKVNHE